MISSMIPLVLNLKDKEVVIFGGGNVAKRKANLFSRYVKRIKVVSKEFESGLKKIKNVKVIKAEINENNISIFLKNAFIAIPATNNKKINKLISKECSKVGILVNMVDGSGDFIVPSIIKNHAFLIGISTYGKSPGMAKYARKNLSIPKSWKLMVRLQEEMRKKLCKKKRIDALRRLIRNKNIWLYLEKNEYKEAKEYAEALLRNAIANKNR
ncbi:MAG: bifunctional precorrin-2 dehydrogenase/sirohydrochlorin ferrochelatase [Candidatus Thermoplasmatota archaeon]